MQIHLHPEIFETVKRGTKNVEARVFDEKRQRLELGDALVFLKRPDEIERLYGHVTGLKRFKNFAELANAYTIERLYSDKYTKEQYLALFPEFYSEAEITKYGTVAIEFELDDGGKLCEAFAMENAEEAVKHIELERIEDYGDMAYGHNLHTWDDGHRIFCRCGKCGGYFLMQYSEYHGIGEEKDVYYTDYFPVSTPAEADKLNRLYNGFTIEQKFPGRYLLRDSNRGPNWSNQ